MATSVVLQKIVKAYGDVQVVHGVDLTIEPGEFTVFVGPSGCGKSTLLRMIAGLEPITGGDLIIDGQRLNDVPAAKRGIAMVFQSYALYPHMSVYQNLAFGLETAKLPKAEIAVRVQMRVEIAKLHNDLGNTMIYVTHDQVEAMTMADKIVVLRAGVIEQAGPPLELYNNPRNIFVAGFIGSPKMNFLKANIEGSDASSTRLATSTDVFTLPRPTSGAAGSAATLGVRPEHITINPGSGLKLADVRVDLVENLGGQTVVYATTVDGQPVNIVLEGQRPVELGSTVTAYIDPARVHLFNADGNAI